VTCLLVLLIVSGAAKVARSPFSGSARFALLIVVIYCPLDMINASDRLAQGELSSQAY
jgi:hypothetical protein